MVMPVEKPSQRSKNLLADGNWGIPFWLAFFGIGLIGVLMMLFVSRAHAHEWFDQWCCNGKDCSQIPTSAVGFAPGSYVLTIRPGDHPVVTRPHTFVVPTSQVRYSPDGQYYLCLWPNEDTVRCLYIPPMGS